MPSQLPCIRDHRALLGRSRMWAGIVGFCMVLSLPVQAQTSTITDHSGAMDKFAQSTGYASLLADRYAPLTSRALMSWDRPCGQLWCCLMILYSLGRSEVSMLTTLNIASINGTLP